MKRLVCLLLAACLLSGCISININLPASPTGTPAPAATSTALGLQPTQPVAMDPGATPTPTQPLGIDPGPTPTAGPLQPTPTIDLTAIPPNDSPPRSLYFLLKSALWVLRPNADKAVRLTAEDTLVTTFDVWPEDGRIAYGTRSGKLYVIMPGQDARLLVKLPADGPYPAVVNGIDWSPDGSQLAYTVMLDGGGNQIQMAYPSSPSGLWTVPIKDGRPTWLMSNRYSSGSAGDDINQYRRLSDPQWSPDGQAVLMQGLYWEWSDMLWLYPLAPSFDDANVHTFEPRRPSGISSWKYAAWTPDSQGLLIAGEANTTMGGLGYAARDGSKAEMWVEGKNANLYILSASLVPQGSYVPASSNYLNAGPGRIFYLASCPVCQDPSSTQVFVQMSPYADYSQNGELIWQTRLCSRNDPYGNLNTPRPIEWQPNFSQGVLSCGSNEIYLLNLHRKPLEEFDLLPRLPALDPGEEPIFRWGEL